MPNLKTLCLIALFILIGIKAFSQTNDRIVCSCSFSQSTVLWLINFDHKTYIIDHEQVNCGIINPNYVKNLLVLKDASATSLYGVRAANGVVIVTLKKKYRKTELKRLKPYLSKI